MANIWTRDDTKEWIAQLENRVEDFDYYLMRTLEWCEIHEVYDDRIVFACSVLTASWVSHLRHEPISKHEVLEMLGVKGWEDIEDGIYEFNPQYENLEHEELLEIVVNSF